MLLAVALAALVAGIALIAQEHNVVSEDPSYISSEFNQFSGQYKAFSNSTPHLALRNDGKVVNWYGSNVGEVPGVSDVKAIASSAGVGLFVKGDGSVVRWAVPDSNAGQNFGVNNIVYTMPLTTECKVWDEYRYQEKTGASMPLSSALQHVEKVVVGGYPLSGSYHALALRTDGKVVAWGSNTVGAVAPHGQSPPYLPEGTPCAVHVRDDGGFIDIAAGQEHSLALRADGTVGGWGRSHSPTYRWKKTVPLPKDLMDPAKAHVRAISAAGDRSLVLKTDGTVWSFGGAIANLDDSDCFCTCFYPVCTDQTNPDVCTKAELRDPATALVSAIAGGRPHLALRKGVVVSVSNLPTGFPPVSDKLWKIVGGIGDMTPAFALKPVTPTTTWKYIRVIQTTTTDDGFPDVYIEVVSFVDNFCALGG
ncbi:MAG: hypothetical protein KIT09_13650 [Bryobacteraceae bacterium]|nr:hypothetical protein [Bryobacteraceae bacterium]